MLCHQKKKQREEQRRQGKLKDNVPIVAKQEGDDELLQAMMPIQQDNQEQDN